MAEVGSKEVDGGGTRFRKRLSDKQSSQSRAHMVLAKAPLSLDASVEHIAPPPHTHTAHLRACPSACFFTMQWHPDKHPGPAKAAAEQKFKEVAAAYESLVVHASA